MRGDEREDERRTLGKGRGIRGRNREGRERSKEEGG
jgi:hypothetical protein